MRCTGVLATILTVTLAAAASGQAPVPRPFPGSGAPPSGSGAPGRPAAPVPTEQETPSGAASVQPGGPAPATAAPAGPDLGGVPVYPSAEYLETFDAGSGQKYVLYGTDLPFADALAYYRTVLKNGGREIYRTPGMHQFDLGRFDEGRMAYPPSVVIKDYTGNNSPGYLHVSGSEEKRFKTIIQIVPPAPAR